MKVDMVHTPREPQGTVPPSLHFRAHKAWPRRAEGGTVAQWSSRRQGVIYPSGPIHPPQFAGAGPPAGPHARTEGGASGRAPGGRAHHATRDVPWREAALEALVVHSSREAG